MKSFFNEEVSLHHLQEYLRQKVEAPARLYQVVGITLLRSALPVPEQEMWRSWAPTVPGSLDKEWTFLGYDVADEGFISGLSNCGYQASEIQTLRNRWGPSLNQWHLFTQRNRAIEFQRMTDQGVDEHAPFCIYGLYSLR